MCYDNFTGLGTSTSKEAKEYFSDLEKHCIRFRYAGEEDEKAIVLVGLKIAIMFISIPHILYHIGLIRNDFNLNVSELHLLSLVGVQ